MTTSHNVPACSCAAGSVVVVDIVSVCTGITTRTTSHGRYLLHASYRYMCIPPTPHTHTPTHPTELFRGSVQGVWGAEVHHVSLVPRKQEGDQEHMWGPQMYRVQ